MKYCEATHQTKRWKTREVMVGTIGVGGDNPIRIQSMTTSDTRDAEATANQIIRLADAGCEIARVTVQGMKEAHACEQIKNILVQRGYTIPLVADIHFFPPAAMTVADYVDKVRINPGNYVDKRASFQTLTYDDAAYQAELERLEEKFSPLVEKCKRLKRAMRIGTNHGSLSDRVMNRFGDSPRGMVESALEFTRVCRKYDFHDIIFSMKASNTRVMIEAYRLLAAEMMKLGWNYPLHLGVTEAGALEEGRVKSAIGVGSLLLDGLGDTIRVSLTEDPWYEIDPCQRLVAYSEVREKTAPTIAPFTESFRKIDGFEKRFVTAVAPLHREGSVLVKMTHDQVRNDDFFTSLGLRVSGIQMDRTPETADAILLDQMPQEMTALARLKRLKEMGVGIVVPQTFPGIIRLLTLKEASDEERLRNRVASFTIPIAKSAEESQIAVVVGDEDPAQWATLTEIKAAFILFRPSSDYLPATRRFGQWLREKAIQAPLILHFRYVCSHDDLIIQAAMECGSLLCDGIGDGVLIEARDRPTALRSLGFNILQGSRMRHSKTEFISCPSCGRTLFDLQEVSARIRSRTAHLPGVKIAIMGCIVNGPGEMADADFGYVGSKAGMIDLYVGRTRVEKDIPEAEADGRLIALIKAHNLWKEPDPVESLLHNLSASDSEGICP